MATQQASTMALTLGFCLTIVHRCQGVDGRPAGELFAKLTNGRVDAPFPSTWKDFNIHAETPLSGAASDSVAAMDSSHT